LTLQRLQCLSFPLTQKVMV